MQSSNDEVRIVGQGPLHEAIGPRSRSSHHTQSFASALRTHFGESLLTLPSQSRFGVQLQSSLIRNWSPHYIDYDGLKKALKSAEPNKDSTKGKGKEWEEQDEENFVNQLEADLDKVYTFQKVKAQEIIKRIQSAEVEVNEVISRSDQQAPNEPRSGQADVPTEEEFLLLEEDLSDVIADVHDLAKFVQLNYTGFQKIIKKHDVSAVSPMRGIKLIFSTETHDMAPSPCFPDPTKG